MQAEIDELRAENEALKAELETYGGMEEDFNAIREEVVRLRKKLAALEAQEPAGYFVQCGTPVGFAEVSEEHRNDHDVVKLYAAAGATK